MAEADYEGSSRGEFEPAGQLDDEFIPDAALPLCAKCLKPCKPLQYYCDKCDSYDAINPLTPYIGFVNIPFNYSIYCTMLRKVFCGKETRIVTKLTYLFITTYMVGSVIVIFGLPIFLISKISQGHVRKVILTLLALVLVALLVWYAHSGRL